MVLPATPLHEMFNISGGTDGNQKKIKLTLRPNWNRLPQIFVVVAS